MLDTSDSAQPEDRKKKASAITIAVLVHIGLAVLFMFIAVSFSKDADTKIEILIGERPGGNMGGVLLVEKKDGNYKKRDDGTPILPVFSTVALSAADKKRMKDSGYQFAGETPVFKSGASR